MMIRELKHPQAHFKMLGFLLSFLSEDDPRPAREQIDTNHVRGWRPLLGFEMSLNRDLLYYMDDTSAKLAETKFRDETILFYDGGFLVIMQEDGSFEVSRID